MNGKAMKRVTAVVRTTVLERVEKHLEVAGVPDINVMAVQGYGDYANFFREPPLVDYARLEIFAEAKRVPAIVEAIAESAATGLAGDGVIAVSPLESFHQISQYRKPAPS